MEWKSRWKTDTASLLVVLDWENTRRQVISEKYKLWKPEDAHVKGEKFSESIKRLTGNAPCPICYGHQQRVGRDLVCVRFPIHTRVLRTKCNHVPHETYPENCEACCKHMGRMMGGLCEHGLYVLECFDCTKKALLEKEGE